MDDMFDVDELKKMMEQRKIEDTIQQFKNEKKEPIIRRKELIEELLWDQFKAALYEDIEDFVVLDDDFVKKLDSYTEEKLEKYDEYITKQVKEYYDAKLKEIDDMEVKVERRSKES